MTYRDAQIGDSVKYITPQKQTFNGKVVMKFATHLVLNRKGQPKVVDDKNFVSLRKKKNV